jgi:hypothetical protein
MPSDRKILSQHLTEAEEHVASGQRIVARQRELVAQLERHGHDSRQARELLAESQATLGHQIDDRNRLRAELGEA